MPRSAATFDFYAGANASLSSSDRVERLEDGREPGLEADEPGLEPSEPGVPGFSGSSSASLSTSGGGPGFLMKNEMGVRPARISSTTCATT